jgi:hypothetical protein
MVPPPCGRRAGAAAGCAAVRGAGVGGKPNTGVSLKFPNADFWDAARVSP